MVHVHTAARAHALAGILHRKTKRLTLALFVTGFSGIIGIGAFLTARRGACVRWRRGCGMRLVTFFRFA
jgi:hypothetical protein